MLLAQSLSIAADLPSWSIAWVNNRYFREELRNPMQWIVRFNIKRTWARSLIHADVDYRSVPTSRLLRCYNQIFYTSWQSISCECSEPKWNCQCHVSHGACERRRYTSNFKSSGRSGGNSFNQKPIMAPLQASPVSYIFLSGSPSLKWKIVYI